MRCLAMTQKGEQCGNEAVSGSSLCRVHSDYAQKSHVIERQTIALTLSLQNLGYEGTRFRENLYPPEKSETGLKSYCYAYGSRGDSEGKKNESREKLKSILNKKRISEVEKNIDMCDVEVDNILRKKELRQVICDSLGEVTDDIFDIVKSLSPVLVGAALAGTIAIPLNPLLFSLICFTIARVGIKNLCNELSSDR